MSQKLVQTEPQILVIDLEDEQSTHHLGELIGKHIQIPFTCFLEGELGVGKTRLVRAIIQSLGYKGNVKSPTYTLVEPYQFKGYSIYHFDLYRLSDPEELDYLGIRDYFEKNVVSFIEWPKKGEGWLPEADLIISLNFKDLGRHCELTAQTKVGRLVLTNLKQYI
jgi:tRNA threonylcarbamoyladenosine biosynthesis protein TsaE